MRALKIYRK